MGTVYAQLLPYLQELTRLQKLKQLPSIQEALKDKFSRFDGDLNPTHDQQGQELEPKVGAHASLHPWLLSKLLQLATTGSIVLSVLAGVVNSRAQ